jgi:hypothetical protein
LTFLALRQHVILSGDSEHLSADFCARKAFGIATKTLLLIGRSRESLITEEIWVTGMTMAMCRFHPMIM